MYLYEVQCFSKYGLFGEQEEIRIEREKFYPGPGLEPGSLALRASTLSTNLSRASMYPC